MSEEKRRILRLLQRLYAAIKSTNKNVSSIKEDNMVLLWENSAPGSAFAAQTIKMDLSDYNWVKIETKTHTGTSQEIGTNDFKCPGVGNTFVQTIRTNTGGSGWWHASREVTISKTGVTFGTGGFRYSVANNQSAGDGYAIPLRIWGIKKSYSVSLVKDVLPPENGGTGVTSLEELKSKLGVISGGGSGGSGGPLTLSDSRLLQTYLGLKNVELYSSDTEWKTADGAKTIPGISNYEKIMVYLWDGYDGIELQRIDNAKFKGTGFATNVSSGSHTSIALILYTDGDTVTIGANSLENHTQSSSHTKLNDAWVKRIVGLEPTAAYTKQKLGITDTTIENGKVKFSPVTVENKVLLWENPKPTEAFAGQTIPLNLSDYDSILVYWNINKSGDATDGAAKQATLLKVGTGTYMNASYGAWSSTQYMGFCTRNIWANTSGVGFAGGYWHGATNSGGASDNYAIPLEIYGIKDNPTVNIPSVDISSVGLGGDITLTDSRQMQKYLALKNKKLWSGDVWNSGTKTIPGISNYQILQCNFDLGTSSCTLIRRGSNRFVGGMNVPFPTWVGDAAIELAIEGDNATITWEWISNDANTSNGAINKTYGLKEIIGLEPTEEYVKSQLELNDTAIENGTVKFKPVEVDNRVLLWENPNPRAQFTPQTVLLENMNDYDSIVIQHNHSDVSTRAGISFLDLATDTTTIMTQTDSSADATTYLVSRIVKVVDGGLAFEGGYYKVSNSTSVGTNLNKYCVPNRIFGVKNKLTVEIPEVDLNGMGPTVDPNKVVTLHDYVVDEYSAGDWNVIKYASGKADLYYRKDNMSFTKATSYGYSYMTDILELQLPLNLTQIDYANGSVGGSWTYAVDVTNMATNAIKYRFVSYAHDWTTQSNVAIMFHIHGLWKTLDTAPKEVAAVKENTARLSIDMDGYEKRTLLWTNSSVTTNFNPQTLTFDGVYDELEVLFNYDVTYPDRTGNQRVIVDDNDETILNATWGGNVTRRVVAKSANGKTTLEMKQGIRYISSVGDSNAVCIPYKVYGIQNGSKLEGKVTGDNLTLDIGANAPADLNPDTLIPSGADLDDYLEPGSYLSPDTNTSKTLTNCPFLTGGFILHVFKVGSVSTKQILIGNSSAPRVFIRYSGYKGSNKYAWKPVGATVTKVWENASPTSTFSPQSITIEDMANADVVRIVTKRNSSATDNAIEMVDIPLNYFSNAMIAGQSKYITGSGGKIYAYYRYFNIAADRKSINVSDAWDTSPSIDSANNAHVVPVAIYLIKGVL